MIITKETDYALRILRVLLDGEKHSVAEMSETELIPTQFAYQILRKLSAGNLVRVSRGALGGCALSCDCLLYTSSSMQKSLIPTAAVTAHWQAF